MRGHGPGRPEDLRVQQAGQDDRTDEGLDRRADQRGGRDDAAAGDHRLVVVGQGDHDAGRVPVEVRVGGHRVGDSPLGVHHVLGQRLAVGGEVGLHRGSVGVLGPGRVDGGDDLPGAVQDQCGELGRLLARVGVRQDELATVGHGHRVGELHGRRGVVEGLEELDSLRGGDHLVGGLVVGVVDDAVALDGAGRGLAAGGQHRRDGVLAASDGDAVGGVGRDVGDAVDVHAVGGADHLGRGLRGGRRAGAAVAGEGQQGHEHGGDQRAGVVPAQSDHGLLLWVGVPLGTCGVRIRALSSASMYHQIIFHTIFFYVIYA